MKTYAGDKPPVWGSHPIDKGEPCNVQMGRHVHADDGSVRTVREKAVLEALEADSWIGHALALG